MRIAGIVLLVVALVAIGGVAISSFVSGRDSASIDTAGGPGEPRTRDLGPQADVGVAGNVVILHSGAADGPALEGLAEDIAGPPSPELAQAGQAVLVRRDPQAGGIVAVSSSHTLRASSADDPRLRAFVEAWLGNPASG